MRLALLTTAVLAAVGCASLAASATQVDARQGGLASMASPAVPALGKIVVIVFENKEYDEIIGDADAPTFNRLSRRYALLTNSTGVVHPSLPNYLALVSGSTQGIDSNCTECVVDAPNLADTLERARKTWKAYAEDIPAPGWTGAKSGDYAKKHEAFLYFKSVVSDPARARRVVGLDQFSADLDKGRLPDFSLITPNLCHDMHDCSVGTGDAWLAEFLPPLLRSPQLQNGVVFVTFDEGDSDEGGGGHIATLPIGPAVRRASRDTASVSHYGLLRTIEDAWGLPRLGQSATARPITGIWRGKAKRA